MAASSNDIRTFSPAAGSCRWRCPSVISIRAANPNTYVVTRSDGRHVVALRPIARDEEITYDYLLNCHGGVVWECRCGSPRCRGVVPASFFDLPPDEQRRLRPLLDGWFVAEHAGR